MDTLLYSPVDQPPIFFAILFIVLVVLTVSVARFFERAGFWLPNLTARNPAPRTFINILLGVMWLYLGFIVLISIFSLGVLVLFGASGKALLYVLFTVLSYLLLSILTFFWLRGGLISAGIMITLIITFNSYVLISKPGWACKPLSESGFSIAYGCLGRAYEYPGNRGLRIDASKMRYWYGRAAEAGDSDAAFLVALKTQDLGKREKLLKQAAEDGHIKAAHRYSLIIKEAKVSLKWLTYAAERGQADALFDLGQRYYTGKGVGKDFAKTREFWIEAAETGSLRAMQQLTSYYANTNVLFDRDVALSEKWQNRAIARKDELARSWTMNTHSMQAPPFDRNRSRYFDHILNLLSKEREQGALLEQDPEKQKKLAKTFISEQAGDPHLRKRALDIYRSYARKSDVGSQYELALILLPSDNTLEQEEGRRWLEAAGERNHEQALRKLIDGYENGKFGFPVDLHKSRLYSERQLRVLTQKSNTSRNRTERQFAYYRNQSIREKIDTDVRKQSIEELTAPAEAGDANAQFQLAHLLMINYKREEGIRWLEKAAENNHADAQYYVARRIMHSALQKQHANRALKYYLSSAEQNHPGALAAVGDIYRSGVRRMKLEKNLYLAKIYYQQALEKSSGETIFKHTFGNTHRTTSVPAGYIREFLNKLPESIKRLDLEGVPPQQKEARIKDWYYGEIEKLEPGDKSADKLKLLNQQRDVLLKDLQKS